MKKIALLLGLAQAATETQITAAIKELQEANANQAKELEAKLSGHDTNSAGIIDALNDKVTALEKSLEAMTEAHTQLEKDAEILNIEKVRLQNALDEAEQEVTELKQFKEEAGMHLAAAGQLLDRAVEGALNPKTEQELREVANKTMATYDLDRVFVTTDATPFYIESDANAYAAANDQRVYPFTKSSSEA